MSIFEMWSNESGVQLFKEITIEVRETSVDKYIKKQMHRHKMPL